MRAVWKNLDFSDMIFLCCDKKEQTRMWAIPFLSFVSFSSCCYIVLKKDKQMEDKYEFQGTSWRALCSNLHPVHHRETAFCFYMFVSLNPPTLQPYKIIHIYVTQNSTAFSYMSITVTPYLPWVDVNLLPGQNHFHLLWEFMPFITTVEQKYPLLITGVNSVESCNGLGWKGPCPDIIKGYLPFNCILFLIILI